MAVKIKTHTFRGKKHDVTFTEAVDGLYVKPNCPMGEIILFVNQSPKAFLEAAVHEAMHALNPTIPEKEITLRAHDVACLLWRLGYRRKETH